MPIHNQAMHSHVRQTIHSAQATLRLMGFRKRWVCGSEWGDDLVSKIILVPDVPGGPVAVGLHTQLLAEDGGPGLGPRPRDTENAVVVTVVD